MRSDLSLRSSTTKLLYELRRRGKAVWTASDVAKSAHITQGSAQNVLYRLREAGLVVRLPLHGAYTWPGWRDKPWGGLLAFRYWLELHPGRGWVDSREAPWLPEVLVPEGRPPWPPRERFIDPGDKTTWWRVVVLSDQAEKGLRKVYNVRRTRELPPGGVAWIPEVGVPIGL